MTVYLLSIPLDFVENVDLVGATYKHLSLISSRFRKVNLQHTIMALTRVSPATMKEPGF
jgi:hypothetical protein